MPRKDREEHYHFTVRRVDGAYHLQATEPDVEHTHHHGFRDRNEAWDFLREVQAGVRDGRELNLAKWESTPNTDPFRDPFKRPWRPRR